ncbi:MAG: hypothetical protein P8178_08120 [Candidatus Thiodiazotropha sp.]
MPRQEPWQPMRPVAGMIALAGREPTLRVILLFMLSLIAVLPRTSGAIEQLDLSLGSVSAADWRAEQVTISLDWSAAPAAGYRLEIGRLTLPALQQTLDHVQVDCTRGSLDDRHVSCEAGTIHLPYPLLTRPDMTLSFQLDRASGKLNGKLGGIALAGGTLDLNFDLEAGAWTLRAQGKGLKLAALIGLWPQARARLQGWSLDSRVALDARLSGRGESLLGGRWQCDLSALSLADDAGAYATDGVKARLRGRLDADGRGWRVDNTLTLQRGDASVHTEGLLDMSLEGEVRLSDAQPLQQLKLRVLPLQTDALYREMLQPVLAGSPWGRFELAGTADLSLDLQGAQASLDLGLHDFNLDDTEAGGAPRRLGLYGVNGQVYWNRGGTARTSHLAWQAGHLLEHIDIGPGDIDFQALDQAFSLTRQARIPVLDGTLVIDRLALAALGTPEQKLQFDGFIEPISMAALSKALGWVPLSGKLSGMIPGLTYENGLLSVDGILLVRIFDGDILIKHLKMRDLFGVYPQLSADIELHGLDLESLTRTFSFGRITGRLDGYVKGLDLEAWQPVSFDARFYTPANDDSRHRISQKAVDNISNLGGAGLSGSLARSFLGFFDEFRYKRIGIGCRLKDGVCDMVGAGKAKQGYYLVEGSGIPRIDIIGFNKTADWSRLVEQLKQITTAGAPVVK